MESLEARRKKMWGGGEGGGKPERRGTGKSWLWK